MVQLPRHGLPRGPTAPRPPDAAAAPHGARDAPLLDDLVLPLFVCPGEGVERADRLDARRRPLSVDGWSRRRRGAGTSRHAGGASSSACPREGRDRQRRRWRRGRHRAARAARARSARCPDLLRHRRRLLLRVHRPRPLRRARGDGSVDNDATLENLAAPVAVSPARGRGRHRRAVGHDGRPRGARSARRSTRRGFADTPILSYAAKYASALLRPVPRGGRSRARVRRPPRLPDGPGERREALREVALDVEEGADMLMVKPALAYLDVIRRRARALRPAARGLPRERRVRHDQGGRGQRGWIDERPRDDGVAASPSAAPAPTSILTYCAREAAALAANADGRSEPAARRALTPRVADSLFARARSVIPGGVNSPVRAFRGVGGDPVFIARGEGAVARGRRRQPLRRLRRRRGGRSSSATRTRRSWRRSARAARARHRLRRADRARGRARRADRRGRARRSRWCASSTRAPRRR